MNDNLVFSVDFGFVILLTDADSVIKFFNHVGSFVVEIVDVSIFNWNSGCISLSYTVNDCIKIGLITVHL